MTARGIRNNNPGNIDFKPLMYLKDKWVGELGLEECDNARFTTFDTPEHGIRALCKVLLTYHRKRRATDGSAIDTVQEIIDRWAPPSENNTDAYAQHVRDLLDVETGELIDVDNPATLLTLAESIIQHENGVQPYPRDVIEAGVKLALA